MEPSVLSHPCPPLKCPHPAVAGSFLILVTPASVYGELVCARHWGDGSAYNGKSPAFLELLLMSVCVSI